MPRILLLIPTLDRGGAEKQFTLLACGLKSRGWDVQAACLSRTGPWQPALDTAGVPVTVVGRKWKLDPLAYSRLRRLIAELKPDLVHTWRFPANSYGRAAAVAAGVRHIVASEFAEASRPWPELLIDRQLARWTDRFVVSSAGIVWQGLPQEKLAVIRAGTGPFQPTPTVSRSELLEQLELPPHARLIGTIGRLAPQKRIKDLVWAMDLLRCVQDDVYLLVIGDGPRRWRFERYARQVSVVRAIRFLGERDDVPGLLPYFSCFWLGNSDEGQSNSLLEAMSAGLPVIVSDTPSNREVVRDEETGFLVKVGDRAGIASRTHQLLQDAELAKKLGAAGKLRVQQEFSVERMVDAHEALYRSLLGS